MKKFNIGWPYQELLYEDDGEYVAAEEAERKINELRAIALEAMYRLRMIGDHDYGVSDYAKKHEEILSKRLEVIGE